ncbi:hypothetical protein [Novosphingobium sp. SG720]|uniref:hypothetical protein n=1 Tax=Novosphingobium sp. SG720 TaxID=2586998 RepID=UPI00144702B3|nr:hypothetical protein [Novosphingobium sp. SG720]NKJ45136.1 hypothetical protein [Novosphingobium sp. SG720]
MKDRRLAWVALGAGLVSVAITLTQILPTGKQDTRFLAIEFSHDVHDEGEVIAAVGQCLGSFKVFSSSHVAMIQVPIKALGSKDFICLIDKLGGVKRSMVIESHEGF